MIQVFCFLMLFCQEADFEGKEVSQIEGEGFIIHDFEVLKNLFKIKVGKGFRLQDVNDDLKALWQTGYFSDIKREISADPQDLNKLVIKFRVIERKKILEMSFVGSSEVSSEVLLNEVIQFKSPFYVDELGFSRLKKGIDDHYRDKGFHFCEIKYELKPKQYKNSQVFDVVWHISEGSKTFIDNIIIESPVKLDADEIKSRMSLRESSFIQSNPFVWSWLSSDLERIKRYLRESQGYLEVPSESAVFVKDVSFRPDKKWADITIYIDPGQQFNVSEITAEGYEKITKQDIDDVLLLKSGDIFTEEKLLKSERKIKDLYDRQGYLNARVKSEWIILEDMKNIKIRLQIEEGNQVMVGQISIKGNTKTKESRIRLDLRSDIRPGEPINPKGIDRAVERLMDRGWFQSRAPIEGEFRPPIEPRILDTTDPNVKDIELTVREGSTALLNVAVGYSDAFGATGLINFAQHNFDISDVPTSFDEVLDAFSGAGQIFSLRAMPQTKRQQYDMTFIEPYLFDMDVGYNLRLSNIRIVREGYVEKRVGGETGIVKRWENLSAGFAFRYDVLQLRDVSQNSPQIIKDLEGTNIFGSVIPSLVYDNRNSTIIPSEGYRFEISYEIFDEILNSDFDMGKLIIENQAHFPVYQQDKNIYQSLSLVTRFGWLEEFDETKVTPVPERFFGGGLTGPRGFRFRGVGPRENSRPVGGNAMLIQSVEYGIPLVYRQIHLAFFYDIGNVEDHLNNLFKGEYRVSAGIEFRFMIPFLGNVPAKLGLGFILNKRDEDKTQFILFDLGPFYR
ncbi:MAG: outer membrane protein assembly factor BamA [Planctomycetes bacterium]|nr:outer membrane protein assembly factor BamA [Planctomycetota bacterium]